MRDIHPAANHNQLEIDTKKDVEITETMSHGDIISGIMFSEEVNPDKANQILMVYLGLGMVIYNQDGTYTIAPGTEDPEKDNPNQESVRAA